MARGGHHPAILEEAVEATAERSVMQLLAEQDLVHGLELGDGEGIGDESEGHGTAAPHVVAERGHRLGHDAVVIEGEAHGLAHGDKARPGGVAASLHEGRELGPHERGIRHGDGAPARVSARATKDADLLEDDARRGEAGLLMELAGGSIVEGLPADAARADANETARQGSLPEKGWPAALDEQHLQRPIDDRQNNDVDGDSRAGDLRKKQTTSQAPKVEKGRTRQSGNGDKSVGRRPTDFGRVRPKSMSATEIHEAPDVAVPPPRPEPHGFQ